MSLEARLDWIEKKFRTAGVASSLSELDNALEIAEKQVADEVCKLRELEEELGDIESELSFLIYTGDEYSNNDKRKAAFAKQLKDDPLWTAKRSEIREQKRAVDHAKASRDSCADRGRNLRTLADLLSAQMKLLAR